MVRTWVRRSKCCYNVRVKQRRDKESTLISKEPPWDEKSRRVAFAGGFFCPVP